PFDPPSPRPALRLRFVVPPPPPPPRPQRVSSGSPLVRGPSPTRSCLVSPAPEPLQKPPHGATRSATWDQADRWPRIPCILEGGVRTVAARSAGVGAPAERL